MAGRNFIETSVKIRFVHETNIKANGKFLGRARRASAASRTALVP